MRFPNYSGIYNFSSVSVIFVILLVDTSVCSPYHNGNSESDADYDYGEPPETKVEEPIGSAASSKIPSTSEVPIISDDELRYNKFKISTNKLDPSFMFK